MMIGPPGIPKFGRPVFALARRKLKRSPGHEITWRWLAGLYVAGVVAHFSHHLAFDLPAGSDPTFTEALTSAPVSLVWPADLIHTLIDLA
jgi:hypothetical protein